jgi:hypothetical protein
MELMPVMVRNGQLHTGQVEVGAVVGQINLVLVVLAAWVELMAAVVEGAVEEAQMEDWEETV